MKILLISPPVFPINSSSTYVGIERLVFNYSKELVKEHEVTVLGHADSQFPEGVKNLAIRPQGNNTLDEAHQYQCYQYLLRTFDVIHDFSHLHLASRFNNNLPSLNLFWHAPAVAKYPKAPYNIIALSKWAAREFERIYRQKARYQQSILLDTSLYKLGTFLRNDRFLAVGRMGREKGNLNAAMLCTKLGLPLDIITARGMGYSKEDEEYEKQVQALCDGVQIKLIWEYTEADKIRYMQSNKALLYITDHPEVTSHKLQECLLCGLPAIVSGIGAAPEIITHGVDGYLCRTEADFEQAIKDVNKLDAPSNKENLRRRYAVENVVKDYIPLYIRVANGERW